MKFQVLLLLIAFLMMLFVLGCTRPEDTVTPGERICEKTVQLQGYIADYSVTVEEKLQDVNLTITRDVVVKRPFMYRIKDSADCYTISNGTLHWLYCNGSNTASFYADASVRDFIADVDYQQIFSNMLFESSGTFEGSGIINGINAWIIETTPVHRLNHLRYDYTSVRLWIDPETGMILQAEMIPEDNTKVGVIKFSNVSVNDGIADDMFTFTPWPGLNVIDWNAGLFEEKLDEKTGYTSEYTQEATPCTDCPFPSSTPRI